MSRQVTGRTGLLCLLGSPVAHSISPAMHNEACALLDLDYTYLAFDVAPDRLAEAVEGLKALGVRGFNVTMPHKTAAAALCERLSPAARICGAVNTVVNEGGSLVGHTTDGEGYMRSAREAGFQPEGKRMVQLGAGGAGTAVLVQAALDGMAAIDVFNPRDAFWPRAERVAAELERASQCRVVLHDLDDREALRTCLGQADLLVNTTPVGMERMPGCLIPDASWLHAGLTVSDVIYQPRETQLLRMAREAGLKTFNGMYMLLHQGAASFRLWTGREMPIQQIREKYFQSGTGRDQIRAASAGMALTALLRLQDGAGGAAGTIQVSCSPKPEQARRTIFLGALVRKPGKRQAAPPEGEETARGGMYHRGRRWFAGKGAVYRVRTDSQQRKSLSMLWAMNRALKLRGLHMTWVEPPEISRSSGSTNLMHLTSTSRQVGKLWAGMVMALLPR